MHFKVKNAVIELSLYTMIVPIFTKGIISEGFLSVSPLPHPDINLKYHIECTTLATRNF